MQATTCNKKILKKVFFNKKSKSPWIF